MTGSPAAAAAAAAAVVAAVAAVAAAAAAAAAAVVAAVAAGDGTRDTEKVGMAHNKCIIYIFLSNAGIVPLVVNLPVLIYY